MIFVYAIAEMYKWIHKTSKFFRQTKIRDFKMAIIWMPIPWVNLKMLSMFTYLLQQSKNETDYYISESPLASISCKSYRNMSYIFGISAKNSVSKIAAVFYNAQCSNNPDPTWDDRPHN